MSSHAHAASPPLKMGLPIPNSKLGMWLFLGTEIMFFTAFIGTYIVLRLGSEGWPSNPEVTHIRIWAGGTNTFVLLASSYLVVVAHESIGKRDFAKTKRYLMGAFMLWPASFGHQRLRILRQVGARHPPRPHRRRRLAGDDEAGGRLRESAHPRFWSLCSRGRCQPPGRPAVGDRRHDEGRSARRGAGDCRSEGGRQAVPGNPGRHSWRERPAFEDVAKRVEELKEEPRIRVDPAARRAALPDQVRKHLRLDLLPDDGLSRDPRDRGTDPVRDPGLVRSRASSTKIGPTTSRTRACIGTSSIWSGSSCFPCFTSFT